MHQTMFKAKAYSAASATSPLASTTIPRREPTEHDVQIEILFCGICHSDLHSARDEWRSSCRDLPCRPGPRDRRPGHQGRFGGQQVQGGRPGRRRLPGRLGPHLPELPSRPRAVLPEHDPHVRLPGQAPAAHLRRILRQHRRRRALRPESRRTSTSPGPRRCCAPGSRPTRRMRHWGVTKGKKVGVVGLGGLGHMGVKFAHAFGAQVVVFTTSPNKKEDALRLGADEVVVSTNADEMKKHAGSFDFILDTVSADTTSTPTSTCSAATATSPWSARPRSRCPSRRSA